MLTFILVLFVIVLGGVVLFNIQTTPRPVAQSAFPVKKAEVVPPTQVAVAAPKKVVVKTPGKKKTTRKAKK